MRASSFRTSPLQASGLRLALAMGAAALFVACGTAGPARGPAAAPASKEDSALSSFRRDRQAILSMAGKYRVKFYFRETLPLTPGYQPRKPFKARARELVKVVEDAGDRIVLQHLLVLERGSTIVTKHWGEIWQYEDPLRYRYAGGRRWVPVRIPPKKGQGTWTQRVTHVDDSPRYEALGQWHHVGGASWWESRRVWRPLPRRERTKRDDYEVLVSRLRRSLTPEGFAQEFDNYKLALADTGRTVLTREVGLTRYKRVPRADFSAAKKYWRTMAPFWEEVRSAWTKVLARGKPIHLAATRGGKRIWEQMFALADSVRAAPGAYKPGSAKTRIRRIIRRYLKKTGPGGKASPPPNTSRSTAGPPRFKTARGKR